VVTEGVDGDYERLSEAGVEFTSPPTDMPYGRDCGLRDPSGNQLRLAQLSPQFAAPWRAAPGAVPGPRAAHAR
jgi:uncharacterized glyoxalase superfamily protein PhnB